jgi:hypothetical protein
MATKKEVYTSAELDWCESKLMEWRQYVDTNPISELKDRLSYKTTSNGGSIPMVVASIESQIKSIRDTMKEYLLMLQQVEFMREKEAQKTEARGGQNISGMMGDFKQ